MFHQFIENELIILTKHTLDIFLKTDNFTELTALYTFYYYTAKWQKTNQVKCTTEYVAKGLKWGKEKVIKIKKQLKEFGLIEDVRVIDEDTKRVTGHYIKMNYIFKKSSEEEISNTLNTDEEMAQNSPESHPPCKAESGSQNTNALSANNLNALSANNIYTNEEKNNKNPTYVTKELIEKYVSVSGKDVEHHQRLHDKVSALLDKYLEEQIYEYFEYCLDSFLGNGQIDKFNIYMVLTDSRMKAWLNPATIKEPVGVYGEYKNVKLKLEEIASIKQRYPDWEERIERLSAYIASYGDKYKSHYAVINTWAKKDNASAVNNSANSAVKKQTKKDTSYSPKKTRDINTERSYDPDVYENYCHLDYE